MTLLPEGLRQRFDLHPEAIYVNAASEGPIPRAAREALLAILDRKANPFRLGGEEYFQVPQRTRELCARLVGCRNTVAINCVPSLWAFPSRLT